MAVVSMKQLLEAGVHFGHQTRRWNPKMAPYIFTDRNGIYIIDLQKTVRKMEEAYNFIRDLSAEGKEILMVGTKKQAQESIEASQTLRYVLCHPEMAGQHACNFQTIRKRIDRLNELDEMETNGALMYCLKEVIKLRLKGINWKKSGRHSRNEAFAGAVFVVDPERNA